MTPAPISVERLRELQREMETACTWEAQRDFQAAALEALPALLQQLAERDAEVERLRIELEVSNTACGEYASQAMQASFRAQEAERARDGMREQLRIESALLLAWARESREGGWSTHQVEPMKRRAEEIDAFLAASGGRDNV